MFWRFKFQKQKIFLTWKCSKWTSRSIYSVFSRPLATYPNIKNLRTIIFTLNTKLISRPKNFLFDPRKNCWRQQMTFNYRREHIMKIIAPVRKKMRGHFPLGDPWKHKHRRGDLVTEKAQRICAMPSTKNRLSPQNSLIDEQRRIAAGDSLKQAQGGFFARSSEMRGASKNR